MVNIDLDVKLENPCVERKDFCVNCHSHFMKVRPLIKGIIVSKHFLKDLKNNEEVKSIVRDILDCSNTDFIELHKFEENVDGNLIFRAKRQGMHIVYCVNSRMNIVFLRVFKNYSEYSRFLGDKKEIKKIIAHEK